MATPMANIICMKWGTKYGPEYVNRLANMVRRNMTIPYRFVCMTDSAVGLDAGIDARPLPDFDDPGGPERGWRKISTFRNPLFDLKGPTIFGRWCPWLSTRDRRVHHHQGLGAALASDRQFVGLSLRSRRAP